MLGYGPAACGLGLFPAAAVIGGVSLGASARLTGRFGPRVILLTGAALILAALALLTHLPVHGSYPLHLLPALVVFGAGGGLALPALATLGMTGATEADAGVTSGLFNTTQQVGAAAGVALLSALAAAHTSQLLAAERTSHQPLTHDLSTAALASGYRLAFLAAACLCAAALLLAASLLRRSPGEAA